MMNILLTSSGRRSYLVKYFKEALMGKGKVFTANSVSLATSMIVSDGAFVSPEIHRAEYISFLKKICRKYDIGLLLSLFDLDLPVLARHREEFEELGVTMTVSDTRVVDICNDKIKTCEFCREIGLKTLWTSTSIDEAVKALESGAIHYPLYIKPRWGTGSIALQKADNVEELNVLYKKVKRDINQTYLQYFDSLIPEQSVIIQETAKGQEYGLDVINDLDGNYITTFVKRKLAMRSGETDGAVTVDRPALRELGEKIGKSLKHVGIMDMDVFWDGDDPFILETNARFGGGYPFSHLAGADLPRAYILWSQKEPVSDEYLNIRYDVKGLKELNILDCSSQVIETID